MSNMKSVVILVLVALFVIAEICGGQNFFDEKRLTKHLTENYSRVGRDGRPVQNQSEALMVKFGLALQSLVDIDRRTGVLTTVVWLQMEWEDELLKWNQEDFGNISSVRMKPEYIFIPDLIPYNVVSRTEHLADVYVVVHSTGTCTYIPPVKLHTQCWPIRHRIWPDVADCVIKYGSWTYDGGKVNVTLMSDDVDTSTYTPNGKWELVSTSASRNIFYYDCCPEPYVDVEFNMSFKSNSF